jgi:hypothetical protein
MELAKGFEHFFLKLTNTARAAFAVSHYLGSV